MTTFLNENQTVASAVGVTSYFQARDTTHINFYKLIKNKVLPPPPPPPPHFSHLVYQFTEPFALGISPIHPDQ